MPETAARELEETPKINNLAWTLASGAVLLVGAFLRIFDLALKPLHHDEGVNGFFLQRLVKDGIYTYDPSNYHGPTLYYFALVSTSINSFFHGQSGLSTVAVRLVPALFGVATIWLVLCLRRYLGSIGALSAAALLALSPGAVYMSRYFIHESLFAFFTLGIVVAWLKYYEQPPPDEPRENLQIVVLVAAGVLVAATLGAVYRPAYYRLEVILLLVSLAVLILSLWRYDGERATYLILAAISAALLFATKETAMISAGVLLIATGMSVVYLHIRQPPVIETKKKKQKWQRKRSAARGGITVRWRETIDHFGGPQHLGVMLLAALAIFIVVGAVFYSSFFTNSKGVVAAFETFKVWTKTGVKDHVYPLYKYARWLGVEESPLLLLGALGIVLAVWRATNRFVVFAALWAFGIIAAYSLIPYKTPWLMLNFIVPLAIIGGYAIETICRWATDMTERLVILAVALLAFAVGAYQTVSLNFFHYDDEKYIYVYAHTVREFLSLVDKVKEMAHLAGTDTQTGITVTSKDYWPLPWYLREYSKVGYFGRMTSSLEPLIICSTEQEEELKTTLGADGRYQRVDAYPLRPGVTLVLYVRHDIAERQPALPASK